MNTVHTIAMRGARRLFIGLAALVVAAGGFAVVSVPVSAAACQTSTDYGKVDSSVSLPTSATYRVWTRIMVPDSTNNTYLLEVNGNCYTVGGGTIQTNTWVWVAHQNGNANSPIDLALSGNVGLKLVGNKPGVKIDRLVFVSDLTCTPSGDGANCNVPSDTSPPSVQITAPAEGATVSGAVEVAATGSDNLAVTKVDFYVNSALVNSDASSPFGFTWDTTQSGNGTHMLGVKAFDAAGNVSTDSFRVTVQNGDQQAPSVPGNVAGSATAYNKIDLNWQASTDDTGIKGYVVLRDSVPLISLGDVTTYTDSSVTANSQYTYQVQAFDAAGNKSAPSAKVSITTPTTPDSDPPSAPAGLTATASSQSQINLGWQPSTDNIGVSSYDIYRSQGGVAEKIANVTSTSYGDTNLKPATAYSYYVVAKDGAGNVSNPSATTEASTNASKKKKSVVKGVIVAKDTRKALSHASVVVPKGNTKNKHIFQANRNGEYRIRRLEAGFYNLSFQARNYNSSTFSMNIAEGVVITKDVRLQKR